MSAPVSKPVHTISVRDLVEFVLRQGDLGGEREFVGSDRALAGSYRALTVAAMGKPPLCQGGRLNIPAARRIMAGTGKFQLVRGGRAATTTCGALARRMVWINFRDR